MNTELVECACSSVQSGFSFLSIVEMFISTFLGFLSALLVDTLWERHKSSSLRKQLRKTLTQELQSLKEVLSSLKDDEVYIKPYSTPVWDGASKSGSVLCLDKDKDFYDILKFFSLIEEANMIEKTAYEILNISPRVDKQSVIENVIEARNQIRNGIDAAIEGLRR